MNKIIILVVLYSCLVKASFFCTNFFDENRVRIFHQELQSEFHKLGLNPKIYQIRNNRTNKLKFKQDRYFLDIQFGFLTEVQFHRLINKYGNKSLVKFDPNKEYNLIDFLPPSIQALVNKHFIPAKTLEVKEPISRSKLYNEYLYKLDELSETDLFRASLVDISFIDRYGLESTVNCLGTTLESLKRIHHPKNKYDLYIPGRLEADEAFNNNDYFQDISEDRSENFDALLVYAKTVPNSNTFSNLQHSAVKIGDNLVFEKTDSSENDIFRIALLSDVKEKYKEALGKSGVSFKYKRALNLETFEFKPFKITRSSRTKSLVDKIEAALKKIFPDINPETDLITGCENASDSGCMMQFSVVTHLHLTQNQKSGRFEFITTDALRSRLMNSFTGEPYYEKGW